MSKTPAFAESCRKTGKNPGSCLKKLTPNVVLHIFSLTVILERQYA